MDKEKNQTHSSGMTQTQREKNTQRKKRRDKDTKHNRQ
jgi:hypothetical protein